MSSPTNAPKPQAFESGEQSDIGRNNIAAAYDAIAADYDAQLAPAHWIRERLWDNIDDIFPAKSRILDVTAGTGLDILHLIERRMSVIACDISPHMLDLLQRKHPDVRVVVSDFSHLALTGEFDGIISTFAGLNTSSNLRSFAEQAARLLRPGGILFIHLLNRWPVFDIIRRIVSLRWRDAWNTIMINPRKVSLGKVLVLHYLYSPKSLYCSVFARHFRLNRIEGYGCARPLHAKWGKAVDGLEKRLASRFPFHSTGIFFSLELIRV